ncbi:MAG TPA: hypothetical protein VKE22_14575 [Haliangiales bacterium]|nr:hypothetical protein [Haliangiales bacterium]
MRILLALMLAAGCASDAPVNVAGNYTLATTNGANGCQFSMWTPGATATGIPLTVTQQESDFTAEIGGLTGALVEYALGSRIFIGTVSGANLHAVLVGTRNLMPGQCVYKVTGTMNGTLVGDALTGTLDLSAVIVTAAADCPPAGCKSTVSFNGTRPPR